MAPVAIGAFSTASTSGIAVPLSRNPLDSSRPASSALLVLSVDTDVPRRRPVHLVQEFPDIRHVFNEPTDKPGIVAVRVCKACRFCRLWECQRLQCCECAAGASHFYIILLSTCSRQAEHLGRRPILAFDLYSLICPDLDCRDLGLWLGVKVVRLTGIQEMPLLHVICP